MATDDKREAIREKIETSKARHAARADATLADQALEAAENAKTFVRKHPYATVAGGIAAGLLIGAMFPAGRRAGAAAGRKVAGSATGAASRLSKFAMPMITEVILAAGAAALTGKDKLEDLSDGANDKARTLKRDANYKIGATSDAARSLSRRASRRASRAVRDVQSRISR